jgi:hypothetical protein
MNPLRRSSSLVSWLGRLGSRRRRPYRRQPDRPLVLERLEDRTVPSAVNLVKYGGLSFRASNPFTKDAENDYLANSGTVSIGYTPAGNESFQPLLVVDLTKHADGEVAGLTLFTGTGPTQPEFALVDAVLDLAAVGGEVTAAIPIFQPVDSSTAVHFDIAKLTGPKGVSLDPTDVLPFEVGKLTFTPSTIDLANPTPGDTSNAQAKLQGQLSFPNVPLLSSVTASVNGATGTNYYVIADHTGITVTGATITKTFDFDSVTVAGLITIGYDKPHNTWNFEGDVKVTTKPQPTSGKVALNSVQVGLQASVVDGQLHQFGFDVSGSFTILGVTVSTVGSSGQPFTFKYNFANQQYELSGGLQVQLDPNNQVTANFVSPTGGPGIVIQNGHLASLDASVSGQLTLGGASLSTTGPTGLAFHYVKDSDQFGMYGGLKLSIPTGETTQVIAAQLGSMSNPGLVLVDGQLTQINMGLSGSFDVNGLHLTVPTANPVNVQWQKADNTFLISGTLIVDFQVFQMTVGLGNATNPGLKIVNGKFAVDNVKFELDNATLGPVTLKQLVVSYTADGNSYDLGISGQVGLPGGYTVGGALDLVQGRLHDIALSFKSTEGIPVGDTGLFLTELSGSVSNIDNPGSIVVTAHAAFTYGETFTLFGQQVKLFRAEGDVTADANELILAGSVQVGAYSTDGGNTWNAVAGSGDAKVTLDWGDHLYSLHLDVNGLFGFIDLSGDLTFNVGQEIKFLATADVVIPPQVPFIGGDKIAGIGFYFDHVFAHDSLSASTTIAAWVDVHVIWTFEVGFQLVYDDADPNGAFSFIGADTIDSFQRGASQTAPKTYTYTADLGALIPAAATSATLSADWSQPASGVTIEGTPTFQVQYTPVNGDPVTYPEDQLPANIKIINDPNFTSGTRKAIQIVGSPTDAYAPITGDYKLLVDVTTQGGNPFPSYVSPTAAVADDDLKIQASYNVPQPTFGPRDAQVPYLPSVPKTPGATFPVTLHGTMDEAFIGQPKTTVSLYRVLASDPQQRPVLIGTATPEQISGDGLNWQATVNVPIDSLYPLPYTVYAVVSDGYNAPVKTGNSAPFTPEFAVGGYVFNQNQDALPGWSVFLDYNRDGMREANEPIFQTSNPDGAYAFAPTFDPSTGWDPVPVDQQFDVRLIVPSSDYVPKQNPVTVTYDGLTTKGVSFAVQQKTSIQGTVYQAVSNGKEPLAGWTVFLDEKGDGQLDPGDPTAVTDANGNYVFFDLPANSTQTVRLQVQPGYYQTGPASYTIAVGSDEYTVYDNNNFAVLPFSTVSGQLLGPSGAPLQGWTVNLTQGGQVIATATSAGDGSYTFGSVRAGSYAVQEVAPLTWQPLAPVAITVPPGQTVSGVNFANVRLLDSLVTGGGFESPVVGDGNYQPNPSGSAWTFAGTSGLSGNGSAFTGGNPNAPQGSQVAFLQRKGVISQAANFTAGTYTLTFLAAQRANHQVSSQTFAVEIDGSVVGTFTPSDTSYRLLSTTSFPVTAGSHVISFVGLDPSGGDNTAFIDAVGIHVLNSLDDPGFERPVVGSGALRSIPTDSPWTFTGDPNFGNSYFGDAGVSGNGSYYTQSISNAPQGNQVAFLQGDGTISQKVNFTAGTYTLTFLAAQWSPTLPQTIGVEVDGNPVGTFTPSDGNYRPFTTDSFPVTTGFHTITFVGLHSEKPTALIDAVSIQSLGVLDGGFETPAVGYGGEPYSPTGSPWVFYGPSPDGGGAGLASNGSYFTGGNPAAPLGSQVAFLQKKGIISQAANFTAGTYTLSFLAAQRANVQDSSQTFALEIDGNVVGTFTPAGTSYSAYTTDSFTVTAGYHAISFVGLNPNGGDNTAFIDGVFTSLVSGLKDIDFETPQVGSGPGAFLYNPSGSAWVFSGSSGVSGNKSGFTAGNPDAPVGSQVAFLQTYGIISQVTYLPGGTYTLSFLAAQRANQHRSQTFAVEIDGNVVGTFTPAGTSYSTYTTDSFTVAGGPHTIHFVSVIGTLFDTTAFIDFVHLDVNDGGFETPILGSGTNAYNYYNGSPAGSPWTFFSPHVPGDGAGISGNSSTFTSNQAAPVGSQVAFLQGSCNFSQSFNFAAGTYTISFLAAQRANRQDSSQTFAVEIEDNTGDTFTTVGTFTPAGTGYNAYVTDQFTVPAGFRTIRFVGLNPNGGDNTAFIDAVSVQPATDLTVPGPGAGLREGGFEAPGVGSGPGAYRYNPSGSAWTFSGTSGLSGNKSGFTAGNPKAPEGGQVAFLQRTGSMSQSLNLAAGTYALGFLAAQRANVQNGGQTFAVVIDGQVVGTFKPKGTGYCAYTTDFSVTAGRHTIAFVGLDPNGKDNTAFLDNVSLQLIPGFREGGFEAPALGSGPGAYRYNPSGSAWTFSGTAGLSGNNSGFTSGNSNAPEGGQVAFLQRTGSFCEAVGLAGGTYALSFLAAQRANFQNGRQSFAVEIDGRVVGTCKPVDTSYIAYTSDYFTVTAGRHTIAFVGLDPNGKDNTAFIDDVGLQLIPFVPGVREGGFEAPAVGCGPGGYRYNPSGSAWTFSGTSGVSGNRSGFTSGNPDAQEGSRVAFLQRTGSISQSLNFAAGTYALSFLAAQRANVQHGGQTFAVVIDGKVVGTFRPKGTSYSAYSTDFTVTAGRHTIAFVGLDPNGKDNTAFLDNVTLKLAR